MEAVDLIFNLQKYDDNIDKLNDSKSKLNSKIEAMNNELSEIEESIKKIEDENSSLDDKIKKINKNVEMVDSNIERLSKKFLMLKTEKELDRYNSEMTKLKGEKEGYEEEILLLMEKIEENEGRISELNDILANKREEYHIKKRDLSVEIDSLDEELNKLINLKGEFVSKTDNSIVEKYEELKNKRKPVVVLLENDVCRGCNLKLSSSVVQQAKMRSKLKTCPNCSRVLYIPER